MSNLGRALLAEFVGTASLLAVVIGSGIMGERLSSANPAVALLANSVATGLALYVLITIFGPISRAHFNPIVTFAAVVNREFTLRLAFEYCFVQLCGAIAGVWLAHVMFALPILQTSEHVRTGIGQWVSEAIATAGLLLTIGGCTRFARAQTAAAAGAYIAAAYWFCIDVIRQSCRNGCASHERYVRRNPAERRSRIYRGADRRDGDRAGRDSAAVRANRCRAGSWPTSVIELYV